MSFFKRLFRKTIGESVDEYSPDDTPLPKIFFGPILTPDAEGVCEARIGYLPNAEGLHLIFPQLSSDNIILLYLSKFFNKYTRLETVMSRETHDGGVGEEEGQYSHVELPRDTYFLTYNNTESSSEKPLNKDGHFSASTLKLMKRCGSNAVCIDDTILIPYINFDFTIDDVNYRAYTRHKLTTFQFHEDYIAFSLKGGVIEVVDSKNSIEAMIRLEKAVENTDSNLNVIIKSMDVDTGADLDHWWFSDDPLSLDLNKCQPHPLGIKEGSKDFWRP